MNDRNDKKLIADYLQGDEKSLEILILRYLKPIYSFVYKYSGNAGDAEDVTQEVFMKAWRNLRKFDRNKNFKSWVFTIAKNASLDFLKKKKTLAFSDFENEDGSNSIVDVLRDLSPLPPKLFELAEIRRLLKTVMEKLLPQYRLVLSLRYNDDLTFRQIAESLGEPLNTVKSRHRRALAKLMKMLS